jgi:hypothetical protein
MNFDAFLEAAWNEHADRPREVADRLAASLDAVAAPADVVPFARLVTHVYGEHLGEWDRGAALLASLRGRPAYDGTAPMEGAIARGIAALRYASGDVDPLAALSRDDAIAALATASSAFAGLRRFDRAIATYDEALDRAAPGLAEGSPALRALAVGGNNLAAALEEKPDRDAGEDAAMVEAAEAGLAYWKRAGGWLEEERAEYRLAQSLIRARRPAEALAAARRCLDVCERHDAPAFERFFAHATIALAASESGDAGVAHAAREHALAIHEAIPAGERQWCEGDLAKLQATGRD